jgi:hypothetical protein
MGCIAALMVGCKANEDMGSIEAMKGSLFGDTEVARVADLMARDLVRDPLFYQSGSPPRLALVRVENDTTQYMFGEAREAYLVKVRTYLKRALKERVIFVDLDLEKKLRAALADWQPDDASTAGVARGHKDKHGVDYFLTARFMSNDKVVEIPARDGTKNNRRIVMLAMSFNLVDAETAELAWAHDVSSAAAYSSRDFQN